MTTKAAIVGSGNIGTDLMAKIRRRAAGLELIAMVGIDPDSDGLARARAEGVATFADGVEGLLRSEVADEVSIVFDATSAKAHVRNAELLRDRDVTLIDLTPAALGPFVVPPVNLDALAAERNVNMVTCGGQATVPIVAAIRSATDVPYAEMVSSIASRSAGPGTRANIDEFTATTARALREVGGAEKSKAIIVLNPAVPAVIMRNTVMCIVDPERRETITAALDAMVAQVQHYVPGYRMTQRPQFREVPADHPDQDLLPPEGRVDREVVTVLLEVEGAADYLPAFAGNLDIMTAAAVRTAERMAERRAAR
jgi:acetaldehyde dehydrogenase